MIVQLHKKRVWVALLFLFFWLQQVLLKYSTGLLKTIVGYSDEVTVCIFVVLIAAFVFTRRIKLLKVEILALIFYLVFAFFGLFSAMVYSIQGWFLSLSDLLVCSKFIVFYFAARVLLNKSQVDSKALIIDLSGLCRIFAVITFVIALNDIFLFPLFEKYDFRYFMYSLKLFFPHPTYMAVACMTAAGVLMAACGITEREKDKRKNLFCIFILFALMCFTLRSKAIAAAGCSFVFFFAIVKIKLRSKVILFGGTAVTASIIAGEQLLYYY